MEGFTIATLVGYIPTVTDALIDVASSAINFCTENPVTLVYLIGGLVSFGVGLAIRMFGSMR